MTDEYPIDFTDLNGEPVAAKDLAAGSAYTYHLRAWDDDLIVMSNDNAERVSDMLTYGGSWRHDEPNRHERRRAAKRARSGR